MNDERFLRDWLQDTTDSTVDPNATAHKVFARIASTPQRRRWLHWPPARRSSQRDTSNDRRTRLMFSPATAIAAGALTLAISASFLIAQPFQETGVAPPGVEAVADAPPSFFVGDFGFPESMSTLDWATAGERPDGSTFDYGGMAAGNRWETDDPRMTGRLEWIWNEEAPPGIVAASPGAGGISTVLMRIANDEGAWTGTATGIGLGGPAREAFGGWLTGEGAYDGLMAYVVIDDDGVFGYITPYGPPPVPQGFPSAPSEE